MAVLRPGDVIRPGDVSPDQTSGEAGEFTRDTGKTALETLRQVTTISGGGGGGARTITTPEEEELIEETRKIGEQRLEEEAARTAEALRLTESLQAREQIRREAQERGRGFTRKELTKRLKELGTSTPELRRASAAARRQFEKTGTRVEEVLKQVGAEPETFPIETIVPTGEVQPAPQPEGIFSKAGLFFTQQRDIAKARQERGESTGLAGLATIGLGIATPIIETAILGKSFIKDPKGTTKQVGSFVFGTGEESLFGTGGSLSRVGPTIRAEPEFAGGQLIGEFLTAKAGGRVLEAGGEASRKLRAGISTVDVVDEGIRVPRDLGGRGILDLDTPAKAFIDVRFAGPIDELGTTISRQARVAGQEVTAVSAQRDLFGTITRRQVKIEKPKPTPTSPELERAFFADPFGRLRVSRLGLEPQRRATFLETLSGDVQIGRTRPQALVFEDVIVARFPRELAAIEKKLKAGKTLTALEQQKLLRFQLTPTGQFKPVGFLSREPEITLAPGEIIKKGRTAGTVNIRGKPVEVILPEIVQPSKQLNILLEKSRGGTLTALESSRLSKLLKQETGFSSRQLQPKPTLTYESLFGGGLTSVSPIISPISQQSSIFDSPTNIISIESQISPVVQPSPVITTQPISQRPTPSPTQLSILSNILSPTPSGPTRPSPTQPIITPSEVPRLRKKKKKVKKKSLNGWVAEILIKKKWKKINPKRPLSKRQARILAQEVADKTIHATSRIKQVDQPAKAALKKLVDVNSKFRDFRIVGGKRSPMKNTWIEKRKFRLDTPKEVRTLQQYKKSAEFEGLFKTKKKKKRKKKKSTGINWFS